jgi:hypothetical protein
MRKIMVMAGVVAAIGAAAPVCGPAFAQSRAVKPRSVVQKPVSPVLKKEMTEQAKIYQTRGEQIPADYVIDRSLLSYATALLPGFDRSLADLCPVDRWLDIGAGQGRAIQDYYGTRYDAMHPEGAEQRGTKAQAVAMSIEDRRTADWHQTAASLEPGKIRYLSGRRLREYTPEELGRFKLATDVYGGFSYTSQLSLFMENILAVLEVNGSFYTLLINVDPEHWPHRAALPRSGFQTEIVGADGAEVKVCTWLKRISCVEVDCAVDERSTTPIERYHVKKTCNKVAVPALESISFSAGTPPARQFQLIEPLPAAPPPSGVVN